MMNVLKIQTIKPKTLSEKNFAYLYRDGILLDFNSSLVLLPNDSGLNYASLSRISIKDFFNFELDNANEIESLDNSKLSVFSLPENIEWIEFPINLLDVGIFNAAASAGEDLYWAGEFIINPKFISVKIAGLVYYMEHKMPKIIDGIEEKIIPIDYHFCYYMNQFFKKITKTKPKNIKIAIIKDFVYITNSDEEFYVLVNLKSLELSFKGKTLTSISKVILEKDYSLEGEKILKKDYIKTQESLIKHLSKVLDEEIKEFSSKDIQMFSSDMSKLYLLKRK